MKKFEKWLEMAGDPISKCCTEKCFKVLYRKFFNLLSGSVSNVKFGYEGEIQIGLLVH